MTKFQAIVYSKIIIIALMLSISGQGVFIDGFPSECAYASTGKALPGHIIRLGFMHMSRYGLSFFFPDRETSHYLSRVDVAENVGLIRQDPRADYSLSLRTPTSRGYFIAAQIFIGDSSVDPIVTCVSKTLPIESYEPSEYGSGFSWLDRTGFEQRLRWKKYRKVWQWKRWWDRDFSTIRDRFRAFVKEHSSRAFGRKLGESDYRRNKKSIVERISAQGKVTNPDVPVIIKDKDKDKRERNTAREKPSVVQQPLIPVSHAVSRPLLQPQKTNPQAKPSRAPTTTPQAGKTETGKIQAGKDQTSKAQANKPAKPSDTELNKYIQGAAALKPATPSVGTPHVPTIETTKQPIQKKPIKPEEKGISPKPGPMGEPKK